MPTTLETTRGQMDGFFSQLPYEDHLEEVASVGDDLKIFPQLDSRVVLCPDLAPPSDWLGIRSGLMIFFRITAEPRVEWYNNL